MENIVFRQILIVGYGDIGQRVAQLCQAQGWPVAGLARTMDKASTGGQPDQVIQADLDQPDSLAGLETENSLIFWFAPPPGKGQTDPRIGHFLGALEKTGTPARIVAISTSGVYGDQQGANVDETTALNPQADRARRRLDMERQLNAWGEQHKVPVIILRVGGIYGPNRLPLKRIRDRVPLLKESLAPATNRIHEDDLAQVCLAAAIRPRQSRIYNVSDGQASNMTEYFMTLADHFNLPRPPEVDWSEAEQTISAGMLSYLKESRRLDTTRMQAELGITLRYPSLTDWLKEIKSRSK